VSRLLLTLSLVKSMSASVTIIKLVLTTAVATLSQGCGTALCLSGSNRGFGDFHGLVYGGVRYDYHLASDDNYLQHAPFLKPVFAIDLPLSLAADTLTLPVTAVIEHRRSSLIEPRLLGTWRSDQERGLTNYHRIYDRYNLSPSQVAKATRLFGRRSITFSGHEVTIRLGDEEEHYAYGVLSRTSHGAVLRFRPLPQGNPGIYEIEFDPQGSWYSPEFYLDGGFFRREGSGAR
jgi:uncharacterized protein YceK